MKYKNYSIEKDDERNWKVVREDVVTADKDVKNPKTQEVLYRKGDQYTRETFKGFYGSVRSALQGVYDDIVGSDCETLTEVLEQVAVLRKELHDAFKL